MIITLQFVTPNLQSTEFSENKMKMHILSFITVSHRK